MVVAPLKCLSHAFYEKKPRVLTRLTDPDNNFKNPFPELTLQRLEWMRNPFAVTVGEKMSHLSAIKKMSDGTSMWYNSRNKIWSIVSSKYFQQINRSTVIALNLKVTSELPYRRDNRGWLTSFQTRGPLPPTHLVKIVTSFLHLSVYG